MIKDRESGIPEYGEVYEWDAQAGAVFYSGFSCECPSWPMLCRAIRQAAVTGILKRSKMRGK
jgi:hypothetical protein